MENSRNDTVKVLIYTRQFKVEGYIHLLFKDSYRGRLSDHLNSTRVPGFIPVTDAVMQDLKSKELTKDECIIINRNLIEIVIQVEE